MQWATCSSGTSVVRLTWHLIVSRKERERGEWKRGKLNKSTQLSRCSVADLSHRAHKAHIKRRQSESLDSWVKPASRQPHRFDWQLHRRPHLPPARGSSSKRSARLNAGCSFCFITQRTTHTEANILLASTGGVASIGAQAGELMSRKVLRLIMVA